MKFNYQARTKEGEIKTGEVEASSREAALVLLEKYGLYVTLLEGTEAVPVYFKKVKLFERIGRGEIVGFTRQLAIMFKSRIPVVEIFYTLGKQTQNQIFREKIMDIAQAVEGGSALSGALARHPKIFDQFFVSIVKSGEVSGELPEVLEYLADHLEKESDFRSKIVGAMIYPILVLGVVVIVIVAMAVFVVPKLEEIMEEMATEPPFMTQLVFGFSHLLRDWGGVFALVFAVSLVFLFRFFKKGRGKKALDRALLRFPIIGSFLQKVYLARFAENLATLISGGVAIAQSLEITAEIVGNDIFKAVILEARDGVRKGETMSSIFEKHPRIVPPLFTQMVLVGERAGQVSPSLRSIVSFYQKDIDRTLENFVGFLEPVMLIFLGIIVAIMVISILMPIYQIGLGEGGL